MQHLITQAANTLNILNVELFWHKLFRELCWAANFLLDNLFSLAEDPQSAVFDWLCVIEWLMPASSFVPRVCCPWGIQQPVTWRRSHLFYVAFSEGTSLHTQDRLDVHVPMWTEKKLFGSRLNQIKGHKAQYSNSWRTPFSSVKALRGESTSHLKNDITPEQAATLSTSLSQEATSTPHKHTLPFTLEAFPWHSGFQHY